MRTDYATIEIKYLKNQNATKGSISYKLNSFARTAVRQRKGNKIMTLFLGVAPAKQHQYTHFPLKYVRKNAELYMGPLKFHRSSRRKSAHLESESSQIYQLYST